MPSSTSSHYTKIYISLAKTQLPRSSISLTQPPQQTRHKTHKNSSHFGLYHFIYFLYRFSIVELCVPVFRSNFYWSFKTNMK